MPDSTISGHHCTLFQSDAGVFYLRDEGSTNGTRVNGVKLEAGQEVPLQHGDIFQVGAIEVMYDTGEFAARSESRTMTVINLEETNTGEVDSTSMKNMAGATATKHAVILRDNKVHNAVMLTIIVLLGLTALGVMAMVAMKIFGKS
jgi:pSer/pThr/pTyr-binding forkhead associated (FHA) protein